MPTATQPAPGSEKFSNINFFLQPVRDLAKNWDIEVAPLLEEYLIELEKIQISFDGGSTTMNFAEAALLIQGSACVYSKKVEYLYDLVYRTMDLISSKKRLQQASSVDNQGNDKDVTRHQEEEFLSLDDIQECKNIDLKEDDGAPESEGSRIIPRTPLALIPMGERDKKDVLLSHTGEVLGSRNDFKMNTCTVHASGALLLDLGNLVLVDSSFRRLPGSTLQSCFANQVAAKEPYRPQEPFEPKQEIYPVPEAEGELPNENSHNLNDDDDNVCDGNDMYDDGDNDGFKQGEIEEEEEEERMQLRGRDRQQQLQLQKQMLKVQDSWELLDPHSPGRTTDKPYKKGRPFKIPASVLEPKNENKKKRKRNETKQKKPYLMPLHEFCTQAFYSHSSKFPKNPLKAPEFKEFEYLYWIEFRRRQEIEKKQKKLLSQYLTEEQIEDLESIVPEYKDEPEEELQPYAQENDGGDYDNDDNDFEGNDDNAPVPPMALEEPPEELVVSSYEDLVRRYVEGYLLEAQQYAQETDLSRRVHEWEEKIVPTLQQEEQHRPYDIHQYGSEILELFQDKQNTSFATMMREKDSFEVCRYFLATLQLANNYNLEIGTINPDVRQDTMSLKLLHKTPAHEAIQTYRAPSIMT